MDNKINELTNISLLGLSMIDSMINDETSEMLRYPDLRSQENEIKHGKHILYKSMYQNNLHKILSNNLETEIPKVSEESINLVKDEFTNDFNSIYKFDDENEEKNYNDLISSIKNDLENYPTKNIKKIIITKKPIVQNPKKNIPKKNIRDLLIIKTEEKDEDELPEKFKRRVQKGGSKSNKNDTNGKSKTLKTKLDNMKAEFVIKLGKNIGVKPSVPKKRLTKSEVITSILNDKKLHTKAIKELREVSKSKTITRKPPFCSQKVVKKAGPKKVIR